MVGISVRGSGYWTAVRNDDRGAARIMVFAPAPELTVTIEDRGGVPDLHLHAGSQGVWQATMITYSAYAQLAAVCVSTAF